MSGEPTKCMEGKACQQREAKTEINMFFLANKNNYELLIKRNVTQ